MSSRHLIAVGLTWLAVAAGAARLDAATTERAIDVAASSARFSVQHVFVQRVTGSVPILSGSVTLNSGSLVPLAASAVLDATRIDTGEADQTAALRGPDFFDTQRFPTWTFHSTKVEPETPSTFSMDGMLTIHGVTQPEHLEVTIRGNGNRPEYVATAKIDRHAFGMKTVPLDPAIGTIVDVTLDVILR